MSTSLDQLKATGTTVVSDSGDFETIDVYKPQDATTNPSLILAAAKKEGYARLINVAVKYAKEKGGDLDTQVENATDRLLVEFGREILQIIPGRVSTEVDASLSYDTQATINKAKQLITLYESVGIKRERVLIKIASTWEGIQAARHLEKNENIHCNLTLLFGFGQAVACAEAGVTLISPFVGRILDWHKKQNPDGDYAGEKDPGVQSVQKIFNYYKQHGYKTIVMGASFRNIGEIKALAGVDYLTIAPKLLEELRNSTDPVPKKLESESADRAPIEKVSYVDDKEKFMAELKNDKMANDKLTEGIQGFEKDGAALKEMLKEKLQQ
ncbi:Transaldolase [Naganishia adeliensis]|uniref:Transaldolase n=1 Tax=Naganishia adeliensis TaxID=92952 RepID=A0ACC2WWC6_9TREE|nr:Transaldolase [Naganishia adeliensis]